MRKGNTDSHGEQAFRRGVQELCERHAPLAGIVARHGIPEYWHREPGFAGMLNIIISQQVSNQAARSINERVRTFLGEITPDTVLQHDVEALRTAGLTRQKAGYCLGIAEQIRSGTLDLDALESLPDEDARAVLMNIRGVGRWTADIYLMFALQRNDIWPLGDLALARAMQDIEQLPVTPDATAQDRIAQSWQPWRGCAARLLWRHYVQETAQGRNWQASA